MPFSPTWFSTNSLLPIEKLLGYCLNELKKVLTISLWFSRTFLKILVSQQIENETISKCVQFHECPERAIVALVAEAFRLLKPGGTLAVTDQEVNTFTTIHFLLTNLVISASITLLILT